MSLLRAGDIRKLTKADMLKKLEELSRSLLEAGGGNKRKPVKKAIARLKTFISMAGAEGKTSKKGKTVQAPVPEARMQAFKKNP